jgi:hypothetical protein
MRRNGNLGVTKVPKNVTVSKLRGNPMSRFVPLCKRTQYSQILMEKTAEKKQSQWLPVSSS